MKKSTIQKLIQKHGSKRMADFMGVDKSMLTKANKQGYAPPEWNYNLLMLIDGKVPPTLRKLQKDIIKHKSNSKPLVNQKQVNEFLSTCQQCRQRVRNYRQENQNDS